MAGSTSVTLNDLLPTIVQEALFVANERSIMRGLVKNYSLGQAQGKTIQTIEGMANGETLHVLQRKFLEHAALQCGICTPGFLIAARSLLERNNNPTEEEVRFWLAGNLCRCTGYNNIITAVLEAAREMRGA